MSTVDKMIEFLPLGGALAIIVLVPVLELPFRRFIYPFLWAMLGLVAARPLASAVEAAFDIRGLKVDTLLLFQGGTVLAVLAIAIGERARRTRVPWRALAVTLGVLSVPMMKLASRVLDGFGPREYFLGSVGVWVAVLGYITGPAALAAFAYLMTVHRIELSRGWRTTRTRSSRSAASSARRLAGHRRRWSGRRSACRPAAPRARPAR